MEKMVTQTNTNCNILTQSTSEMWPLITCTLMANLERFVTTWTVNLCSVVLTGSQEKKPAQTQLSMTLIRCLPFLARIRVVFSIKNARIILFKLPIAANFKILVSQRLRHKNILQIPLFTLLIFTITGNKKSSGTSKWNWNHTFPHYCGSMISLAAIRNPSASSRFPRNHSTKKLTIS